VPLIKILRTLAFCLLIRDWSKKSKKVFLLLGLSNCGDFLKIDENHQRETRKYAFFKILVIFFNSDSV
jgi:hypothetical protein